MPFTMSSIDVKESTSALYTAVIQDNAGNTVSSSILSSLTLTMYNEKDGTTINSIVSKDVLNRNGVTVNTSGVINWLLTPSDNVIVDTTLDAGQEETHKALFEWTTSAGTLTDRYVVDVNVTQIDETPVDGGATLVSSWSGGTSNVYVGYTHANSVITTAMVDNNAWRTADTAQRKAALIEATRDIDSRPYIYSKYNSTQRLEFPRSLSDYSDVSNASWDANNLSTLQSRMQYDVEMACCHQAVHILKRYSNRAHREVVESGIVEVEKEIKGEMRERFKYATTKDIDDMQGSSSKNPLCKEAIQYLSDWMLSGRRVLRA